MAETETLPIIGGASISGEPLIVGLTGGNKSGNEEAFIERVVSDILHDATATCAAESPDSFTVPLSTQHTEQRLASEGSLDSPAPIPAAPSPTPVEEKHNVFSESGVTEVLEQLGEEVAPTMSPVEPLVDLLESNTPLEPKELELDSSAPLASPETVLSPPTHEELLSASEKLIDEMKSKAEDTSEPLSSVQASLSDMQERASSLAATASERIAALKSEMAAEVGQVEEEAQATIKDIRAQIDSLAKGNILQEKAPEDPCLIPGAISDSEPCPAELPNALEQIANSAVASVDSAKETIADNLPELPSKIVEEPPKDLPEIPSKIFEETKNLPSTIIEETKTVVRSTEPEYDSLPDARKATEPESSVPEQPTSPASDVVVVSAPINDIKPANNSLPGAVEEVPVPPARKTVEEVPVAPARKKQTSPAVEEVEASPAPIKAGDSGSSKDSKKKKKKLCTVL